MSDLEKTLDAFDRCLLAVPEFELGAVFDASFLAQMPLPQLEGLLRHLYDEVGACRGHEILEALSGHSARVRWRFDRGQYVDGVVGISEAPPHRIVFLNFGLPSRARDTWAEVEAAARALPGQSAFEVRDLASGRVLGSHQPERLLGAGSTSKLLLFSRLLGDLAAGERRWEDRVVLGSQHLSAPSGIMHLWPLGGPLTLHTAAVLLISLSDNTAADLLLDELGRGRIEQTMDEMGVGTHELSRPFLSTRAVFRLVASPPELQERYRRAAHSERLQMLRDIEAARPQAIQQTTESWREGFDWYFSAAEVVRMLDHLRRQIAEAPMGKAIFGMSPAGIASDGWKFVGYKGGSSPGRLALAALLEDDVGGVGACLLTNTTPETFNMEAAATVMKRATDLALARPREAS